MARPIISVITPVYKVEKYLPQCVDSILNQTFGIFELILVDDGSPDRCGEICDEYASKDSRIKVIRQANKGLSAARNAGIDVAAGEYLAFVDSDDYIHKEALETLYSSATANDVGLVICNFERVSDGSFEANLSENQFPLKGGLYSRKAALKGLCGRIFVAWVVCWNKLYKRELFSEVRFPIGKVCEDSFIMHKIFSKLPQVNVVDRKLYFYRDNPNSITHTRDAHYRLCFCEGLISRLYFFEQNNMVEEIEDSIEHLVFHYYSDVFDFQKFMDASQKKRFLKLKKDVRHFFYKYKKNVSVMEKFYFEAPKLFSFLKSIRQLPIMRLATGMRRRDAAKHPVSDDDPKDAR